MSLVPIGLLLLCSIFAFRAYKKKSYTFVLYLLLELYWIGVLLLAYWS